MNRLKIKWILLAFLFITILFFSNNSGLVDIEKTAIFKAIAVDIHDGKYAVTAQIAVPEAIDTNTEDQKTQITGYGSTVGSAIKNIGDMSGWYPQLAFCNLIVLGKSTLNDNVIKLLDYFAKTLRIQDSALVVLAEEKASELLDVGTPLDNISSIALQKKLLKNPGFDRDVATNDIKTFCSGYYSKTGSSFMPIVKLVKPNLKNLENSENQSSGLTGTNNTGDGSPKSSSSESKTDNTFLFDTDTTALFKNGIKVGELDREHTKIFNALTKNFKNSTLEINNIKGEIYEKEHNYLLTILRCTPKMTMKVDTNQVKLIIDLNMYCKITDQDVEFSDSTYSKNTPLPASVSKKAEEQVRERILSILETIRQTDCDILKIKDKIYKYHHKYYSRFKDNYLELLTSEINVKVTGQK